MQESDMQKRNGRKKMITIYGKENCNWCVRAKDLANRYQLKYEYLDVGNPDIMSSLKTAYPDVKTVPQIWWGDRHIGGYDSFAAEIENTIGNYGQGNF